MAKTAETQAAPEAERRGRGRPRPQEVIDRDELVYSNITEPVSRKQLIEKTGLAPSLVYLSLWRLHRGGRIVLGEGEHARTWSRAS